MSKLKIESRGMGYNTYIYQDGKRIKGVSKLTIEVTADQEAKATLEFDSVELLMVATWESSDLYQWAKRKISK